MIWSSLGGTDAAYIDVAGGCDPVDALRGRGGADWAGPRGGGRFADDVVGLSGGGGGHGADQFAARDAGKVAGFVHHDGPDAPAAGHSDRDGIYWRRRDSAARWICAGGDDGSHAVVCNCDWIVFWGWADRVRSGGYSAGNDGAVRTALVRLQRKKRPARRAACYHRWRVAGRGGDSRNCTEGRIQDCERVFRGVGQANRKAQH